MSPHPLHPCAFPDETICRRPWRSDSTLKGLHPREAEVAAILAEGDSNRAIAAALEISEGTVRKHVNRIFLKLGVHNRAAATRAALGVLPRQES